MRGIVPRRSVRWAVRSAVAVTLLTGPTALATAPARLPVAAATTDPVIAAAGDVACDPSDPNFNGGAGTASFCRQRDTALLLDAGNYAAVLPLGDEQYTDATLAKLQQVYDPTWGSTKGLHRPVPGNHEYLVEGAAGYFDYYGAQAGARGSGWYSYDVGSWHLVALNSNCAFVSCDAGSAQETWLRQDLAAHPAVCTLAYFHHPLFASDVSTPEVKPLYQALYDADADVVLTGHQHNYERFVPMDPDGRTDNAHGLREFIVGTGGKDQVAASTAAPGSVLRTTMYGILAVTLHPTGYDWRFVTVDGTAGGGTSDSGTAACHGGSASPTPTATSPTRAPSATATTGGSPTPTAGSASPITSASPAPSSGSSSAGCDPAFRVSAADVPVGQPVDVDVAGLPPGSGVSLEGYARPSTTYTQLRSTSPAAADGTVHFTVRPTTNTRLRVRVSSCTAPGTSRVVLVEPHLTLNAARTGIRRYLFSGTIVPGRANGGRQVSLWSQPAGGTPARRAVTTVLADGSYSVLVQFSGRGRFTLSFRTGGNVVNTAGTSLSRSMTLY